MTTKDVLDIISSRKDSEKLEFRVGVIRDVVTSHLRLEQQLAECEMELGQTRLYASEKIAEKDRRIAELEEQIPKWRDAVSDPPEDNRPVWLSFRYGAWLQQQLAFFGSSNEWMISTGERVEFLSNSNGVPFKWCELPSPPKESEQGG